MPIRNIHEKPFDEGTVTKLDLYRRYLREWLPTFIHTPSVKGLQVFDFFAGPGSDLYEKSGSPLVALEEVRNALKKSKGVETPPIRLYFNEFDSTKAAILRNKILEYTNTLPGVSVTVTRKTFEDAFLDWEQYMTGNFANLVFLDQNGVKFVSREVFQYFVSLPKTDILFFISSAMVNRFKEQPEIRDWVPVSDADIVRMNGTNVHRILAESYQRLLPEKPKYYIAPFSIRKGANVYGLVFGSGHLRGIDKFLRVAWKMDKIGGEANFDIDGDGIDPARPRLFPEMDKPKKISEYEVNLREALLSGKLQTNKDVFEFGLKQGVLPTHSRAVLKKIINEGELPKQMVHISYDAWAKPAEEMVLKGGES